jgi:hydroxymethylpyrimidine pyrophosphatase-like HAD family hydrolase
MIVHEPDGILEIGQAGHSKASGIERLCASLGIAKEDTYAFGDSANDVEMLEFVAHGIAMGNGTDVAKNAAEFITTDIHKDGIWNGLKHYGLI